jgi:amidase
MLEQVVDLVESLGMTMTRERVAEFLSLMEDNFVAYDLVDQTPDYIPTVKYSTHSGLST